MSQTTRPVTGYDNEDLDENRFKIDRSVIQILDIEEAWAEKEYEHYLHLTPAGRIAHLEDLRRMTHGIEALNARFPRPVTVTERPWR